MTEGPPFYDLDFLERPVTWHRLRPEREVEAEVPEAPLPHNMQATKRVRRIHDPKAPLGHRLKAMPYDPLEARKARRHEVGSGYDRYEVEIYERDQNAGLPRLFGDAVPLDRPLGMPWEFGELLNARDAAIEILRAYNFPTFRPRLHYDYAQTIQPLAFAYAWAWHDDDLVWCEDPTGGGGSVFLREADEWEPRHVFTDVSGRDIVFGPARLSWRDQVSNCGTERFYEYLPRTSAFHWAWQVENLCWFSDIIATDPPLAGSSDRKPRETWQLLGSAGYFFGNWFTDFHSRRRHDDDIKYGRQRKPGAERQGQAGAKNARDRAWNKWGKIIQPWVKSFISGSEEPNLGVGRIHGAVLKAIVRGDLPNVEVPTDHDTFKAALHDWEEKGLIPTWSGLARFRKRKPR